MNSLITKYRMMSWLRLTGLLVMILAAVVGCGAKSNDTPDDGLPLADGMPTLLFFYTDN